MLKIWERAFDVSSAILVAGMEKKAEKGLWNGGARPLGYLVDKKTHKLVVNEAEAATVRLIFDSYTRDRLGTKSIATMLNDRGLRTRMGKSWSPHTIELIITNRVYLGEKHFRDIAVTDAHPAIITTEQFDLAQRILAKRSADIGRRAANSSDYELTGKIRCPQCGRRYIGTAAHGRNHRYRYYICWSRARYGTNAECDNHRFNADNSNTPCAKPSSTSTPPTTPSSAKPLPSSRPATPSRPAPTKTNSPRSTDNSPTTAPPSTAT
ncbi:recombinase family protein [Micromonospora eburnea]|uniref:recombinase family protein n=1 Tax=Micromonospora eburnea TaxID=227316 RepID=UPI0014289595|nr:recombinase family protein [Micromonospora eburnea]